MGGFFLGLPRLCFKEDAPWPISKGGALLLEYEGLTAGDEGGGSTRSRGGEGDEQDEDEGEMFFLA